MSFAWPWMLLGLVPFAGLVVYLLRGRPRDVGVPFLALWRGPVEPPRVERAMRVPPAGLLWALAGILLGLLAAARPNVRVRSAQVPVKIVLDRGITMSAREGGESRLNALARSVREALRERRMGADAKVVTVPRSEGADLSSSIPPTAVDTRQELERVILRELAEGKGLVLVLTDLGMAIEDARVVLISPETRLENVGIAHFAVRDEPAGQAMVTVRNDSARARALLRLESDDGEAARLEIELPERGETREYFVDVRSPGRVVTAVLEAEDDLSFDNRASAVLEKVPPRIEVRTTIWMELERLIEQYARLHAPGERSQRVVVMGVAHAGSFEERAVFLATGGASRVESRGDVVIREHPITRHLAGLGRLEGALVGDGPMEAGWETLVSIGGRAAVAVRQSPSRQVWVGFRSEEFAGSAEFVMLWSNIFGYFAEGASAYAANEVGALGAEWSAMEGPARGEAPGLLPGMYRRSDGALLAVNAPAPVQGSASAIDWRAKLTELAGRQSAERPYWLSRPLVLGALACVLMSAMTWGRRAGARGAGVAPAFAANTAAPQSSN